KWRHDPWWWDWVASPVAKGMVTTEPTPPIFVLDARGNDGAVFLALDDAKKWIEIQDVEEGREEVFDSLGRELSVSQARGRPLVLSVGSPANEMLARRLRSFVAAIGEPLP